MATNVFLLVNGLGVVFLVYVLINFWKEARQLTAATPRHIAQPVPTNRTDVVVVTLPISHSAYGGLSVIPMQVRGPARPAESDYQRFVAEIEAQEAYDLGAETPRRISTR
jgi:hypothetical protein